MRSPEKRDSSASTGSAISSKPISALYSQRRWSMNHAVICCTLISWASIVPATPFVFVTNRRTANTHFQNFCLDFSMFVPVRHIGRDRCGTAREAIARTY